MPREGESDYSNLKFNAHPPDQTSHATLENPRSKYGGPKALKEAAKCGRIWVSAYT